MNGQKGFLIAIIAIATVGVALQIYSMSRKKKEEIAKRDYQVEIGDLEQEILED